MLVPLVEPWIEQPHDFTGIGINAGQIASLMEIALRAGECQVVEIVGAVVLSRNDMFNLQRDQGRYLLPALAIFATVCRPLPDGVPRCGVHSLRPVLVETESGLGLQHRQQIVGFNVRLVLLPIGF